MKTSRFLTSISEMIQDRVIVTMEHHRNSYAIYRMVPFPMATSDLKRLSEIFNDTKNRAASLRQLSFLFWRDEAASHQPSVVDHENCKVVRVETVDVCWSENVSPSRVHGPSLGWHGETPETASFHIFEFFILHGYYTNVCVLTLPCILNISSQVN